MQSTPIIEQILPVVDYFDRVKEGRTGLTKASTGMDPDVFSKESTKGAFMENLNRASQKIEMITRMIAETGVKELVMQVHGLLIRHQDKPRMVRLRGSWSNINPQEWRERTDLTVKVGLGTGNEEQKREKLMLVAQLQQQIGGAFGLVGPSQAYSLFEDLAKDDGLSICPRNTLWFRKALSFSRPCSNAGKAPATRWLRPNRSKASLPCRSSNCRSSTSSRLTA